MMFVEGLYILLKRDINIDELNRADSLFHEFVAKSEEYFGERAMTFNLHQLLHICRSVLNFGPLCAHSTYGFEAANHYLLKAIHSAKGVPQQICRYVHINHSAAVLQKKVYQDADEVVKLYCDEILNMKVFNSYKPSKITYFGKGCRRTQYLVTNLDLPESSQVFDKMVKDGCLYESCLKLKHRSNNSFARLQDGTYIKMLGFIVNNETREELTICHIIKTRNAFHNYIELQLIERVSEEYQILQTSAINSICIFMKVLDKNYICSIPNLLHY